MKLARPDSVSYEIRGVGGSFMMVFISSSVLYYKHLALRGPLVLDGVLGFL